MKKVLHGIGVSFGQASGKVRVVKDQDGQGPFEKGEILVTEITNPMMVPIMGKAAAIVCEIGGITSHPSIVTREMGIPGVVAAKDATKLLRDGMEVLVNGETGEIFIVNE